MFSKALVLARIAFANIFSSLLNVFVGVVLLFGAALLVVGGSLFTTLDGALSRSIVSSVTGHLQVYGARSRDPLEIYGKVDGSDSNLVPLDDYPALKARLLAIPNVDRVVPMGTATAMVGAGNTVDVTLEKLRALHRDQADPARARPAAEFERQAASLEAHVRHIVEVLRQDLDRAKELAAPTPEDAEAREVLARAASEEFWAEFRGDVFGHLEFLENRVAPLLADGDMVFIRYLGTDLDAYQDTFDRMVIVQGQRVPPGHRGVLLPRFFCEELLKLKNARRLDKMKDARESGRRLDDLSDKDLQRYLKENQAQVREIVLQLDGLGTQAATQKLQAHLRSDRARPGRAADAPSSPMTDDNFDARYRFFYDELAPLLHLYRVRVGDTMTLRSFGRSGSVETALVKVYGIFELRGLEKSPLAGANALVDLITFRDLYGFLTAERKAELDALKAAAGARQVSPRRRRGRLFGGDAEVVHEVQAQPFATEVGPRDAGASRGGEGRHLPALGDRRGRGAARRGAAQGRLRAGPGADPQRHRGAAGPRRAAGGSGGDRRRPGLVATGRAPFALAAALRPVLEEESARLSGHGHLPTDELLALQAALKNERASLAPADIAVVERLLDAARPRVWVVGWEQAAGFLGKFIDVLPAAAGGPGAGLRASSRSSW